jgi:Family of unknown function (DUF6527)
MKLTELEPRWFTVADLGRVGLTFDCPHCRIMRLGVVFHHKGRELVEDEAILAKHGASDKDHIWTMVSSEDFNVLTLTPSINAADSGHWHGFITNGEIE